LYKVNNKINYFNANEVHNLKYNSTILVQRNEMSSEIQLSEISYLNTGALCSLIPSRFLLSFSADDKTNYALSTNVGDV